MTFGMGGSSVISRALGAKDNARAQRTFGNLITLTFILTLQNGSANSQEIADMFSFCGVRAILNFAPANITVGMKIRFFREYLSLRPPICF